MIIYKTTNLINFKSYVGQDSNNNPDYFGSGLLLERAIKKYGKENFRKDILEYCSSQEELNKREKFWIKLLKTQNKKYGYNIANGGDGGRTWQNYKFTNPKKYNEIKEKCKRTEKQKEQHRKIMSGKRNPMYGKIGKNHPKYGKSGHIWTKEQRKKQSDLMKIKMNSEGNPNFGLKRTLEQNKKNRLSHLGQIPWNKGLNKKQQEEYKKKVGD